MDDLSPAPIPPTPGLRLTRDRPSPPSKRKPRRKSRKKGRAENDDKGIEANRGPGEFHEVDVRV